MIFHNVAPRSQEWYELRLGVITASEFHKIVTPGGKASKQADGYMNCLLAEWIVGHPLDNPETQWMVRGTELEDQAIRAAEFHLDIETEQGGFFTTDDGMIGASPDRLIGKDRLLEIKCGKPSTHVGYMLTNELESDYKVQLQGQLYVTERQGIEIVAYCEEFPTVVMSVARDEEYIKLLASGLKAFADVLALKKGQLDSRFGPFKRQEATPPAPDSRFDLSEDDLNALIAHHEQIGTWKKEVTA